MSEGKKLKVVVIHDKEAIAVIQNSAKRMRCSGCGREPENKSSKKRTVLRKESASESNCNRRYRR
jgi:hypothetical protein